MIFFPHCLPVTPAPRRPSRGAFTRFPAHSLQDERADLDSAGWLPLWVHPHTGGVFTLAVRSSSPPLDLTVKRPNLPALRAAPLHLGAALLCLLMKNSRIRPVRNT